MARRVVVVGGGLVAVVIMIGALLVLRCTTSTGPVRGIDLARYHATTADQLLHARGIAARPRPVLPGAGDPVSDDPLPDGSPGSLEKYLAAHPHRSLTMMEMLSPCDLGPRELCDALREVITQCADQDAEACLVVGRYVEDTPPRATLGMVFFGMACRHGNAEACERMEQLNSNEPFVCEDDPFRCAHRAIVDNEHGQDLAERSCARDVGDGCTWAANLLDQRGGDSRPFLEQACELGQPQACRELATRLSADCKPTPGSPCYEPDAAETDAALEIACAAGFCDAAMAPGASPAR